MKLSIFQMSHPVFVRFDRHNQQFSFDVHCKIDFALLAMEK